MLPISLSYCLFMLSCFGSEHQNNIWFSWCPADCQCFDAPSDGLVGSDAVSLICSEPQNMLHHYLFTPNLINTLVLQNSESQYSDSFLNKYSVISIILHKFVLQKENTIFQHFNEKPLKYLSIYEGKLYYDQNVQFSWNSIEQFSSLEAINIEDCHLEVLDDSFGNLKLPELHIIIIKSSKLELIYREAFLAGKEHLRKLILSQNKLTNLVWLTVSGISLDNLWFLDLSSNYLNYLPPNLQQFILNLKVLNLENNRFLYFNINSLSPWFGIDELSLFSESQVYDTLPYTNDMLWLKKLPDYIIEANFVLNSFVGYFYLCPGIDGPVDWMTFITDCTEPFKILPGHVHISSTGKLVYENQTAIELNGINFPFDNFTFDFASTSLEYKQSVHYLNETLHLDGQKNAIRVQLFSEKMLLYLVNAQIDLTDGEIQLFIEQVAAFLDEAEVLGKLVLLVMWNYEDIVMNGVDLDSVELQLFDSNFEYKIIEPLLTRICHKSSLIGIEVISNFLSDQFIENQQLSYPDGECHTNPSLSNEINSKLHFLQQNALIAKKYFIGKPIGVAITADCYLCLPFVAIPNCLPTFKTTFDFITIISTLDRVEDEKYSYLHYQENVEPLKQIVTAFESVAIFFVIESDIHSNQINAKLMFAIASVRNYAAGVFVN